MPVSGPQPMQCCGIREGVRESFMEWVEMLASLGWGSDIRQRGQLEESHGRLRVGRFI